MEKWLTRYNFCRSWLNKLDNFLIKDSKRKCENIEYFTFNINVNINFDKNKKQNVNIEPFAPYFQDNEIPLPKYDEIQVI